jgi:hypothetical protein
MNRRSLLKNISILSAATLMPRSVFADKCVDNQKQKTGPCIVFSGLWAFWITDSGVTALTTSDHKIDARAWESRTTVRLPDKKYSVEIAKKGRGSSANDLIKKAHDGKLSIVLPAKQSYRHDQRGRTFGIRDGADYVSIQLPLPESIAPLNYVKVDEHTFTGDDLDIVRGADGAFIRGFPTMQVFVYSGGSATLNKLDGQVNPALVGRNMENVHLSTVPPPPSVPGQHASEAFASLVGLFQKKQAGGRASQAAQPLDLSLHPSFPEDPTTILDPLPPGVECGEVIRLGKQDTPFVNCDAGTLIILGG